MVSITVFVISVSSS